MTPGGLNERQVDAQSPDYEVEVRAPADTPALLRQQFMALVLRGGEVRKDTLPDLVDNALVIGFAWVDQTLAAVGGVKRPNVGYRAGVFAKAGLSDPGRYPYELGWVFVEERFRGLGIARRLTAKLVQCREESPVYATSRVDNTACTKPSSPLDSSQPATPTRPTARASGSRSFSRRPGERPHLAVTSSKRAQADRLDTLREEIARAIGCKKSYQVPSFCVKLRLQESATREDEDIAFRSKRLYVLPMLEELSEPDLLDLARRVLDEVDYAPLELLFTEMTQHGEHRVSQLVRKDVLQALNQVDRLFGDRPILDTLERVVGSQAVGGEQLNQLLGTKYAGPITQHYIRNDDWSHSQLLEYCGLLECPQTTFFRLIDAVLDPMVRRDQEQSDLANAIAVCLQRDGFTVKAISWQSGYPVFGVTRAAAGVLGSMKNLIFASIGQKPELVFRDAVNNDVEIVKNADKVLIFDQPLPSGLLSWAQLQAWWGDTMKITDEAEAKRTLFLRLQQSVKETDSPGEYLLFRTYYEHFGRIDPGHRPALLPQVYLHYDPYTRRERGLEQVLARQRMDFLMLLASGVRVVLEIDGQHHYGDEEPEPGGHYRASASKYAAMAAEDRRLRLSGYEVYRFGALELVPKGSQRMHVEATTMVVGFFNALFKRHGLTTVD